MNKDRRECLEKNVNQQHTPEMLHLTPEWFHEHGSMAYSLQIYTTGGWQYLKGELNSQTVHEWMKLIRVGENLTTFISNARH